MQELEKRICEVCQKEKTLIEDFRYTKKYKCYSRTCRNCKTEQERKIRQEKKETNKINKREDVQITEKKCLECDQVRPIDDFRFHNPTGYFLNTCKECENRNRRRKYNGLPEEQVEEFNKRRREYYKKMDDRATLVYSHCSTYDKKRNLECDLDLDYIKSSLIRSCLYCGFPSTGLDRIVNGIGHTKDNCVPCCRDCNVARSNHFTVEEMKIIGIAINEVKRQRLDRKEDVIRDYYHKGE